MNYLIVGAGNASRPVARLLNYLGHDVTVTDLKDLSEFKIEFQRSLIEMEKEGVNLDLAILMQLTCLLHYLIQLLLHSKLKIQI